MSNSKIFHKDFRMKISARVCAECPSLREARAFMERHRFEGAALEELANAIQAEAILCVDDHQANLALEAEGVICSDLIPEPTDYETRDHSEDCTKLGDNLTSTVVDTMR